MTNETLADLEAIRRRHAAATPGPWFRSEIDDLTVQGLDRWVKKVLLLRLYPARHVRDKHGQLVVDRDAQGRQQLKEVIDDQVRADRDFVEAAWEDVRRLLEEVDALKRNLLGLDGGK